MKKSNLIWLMLLLSFGSASAQEVFNTYQYGKRTVMEFQDVPRSLTIKDEFGNESVYERISDKTFRLTKAMPNFTAHVNGKLYRIRDYQVMHDEVVQKQEVKQVQPPAQIIQAAPMTVNAPMIVQVQTPNGLVPMIAYPTATISNQQFITPSSSLAANESLVTPSPKAKEAAKPMTQSWNLKPEHRWLQQAVEAWGAEAGYEVFWETRDFELPKQKSDRMISSGSFFDALTILGEAYRNSDAPFQIQPTDFKQIIVRPMAGAQQSEIKED
ncbi:MAG: hypothetical protein Q7T74_07005 [Candidatus Saccharibacteria bacterium]|nr:hypothetical protein [Candidatus Saccharibacteria bacterium]